ncbi:MAG: DUF11 domain-containing protein [Draconibacterium sp.]|nr:DUF11 domain-containing protein [Draconibacterium sp.]
MAASDLLPDGSTGTLTGPAESISANSELNVGESWIYTISYTVTQTDMDAGTELTNTVSVVTTRFPGPTLASALTPLSASASLTVDKVRSDGTDPVTAAREIIDYTITVQNTGGLTITGVAASDLLPDGSAGSLTGPTESISANSELNVGESWTYTISYTVTQTDMDAGTELTNTVSVVSDQVPGPTLASALTPLSASASLTVDKVRSNGTDPVTAEGEIIDYTITVQNTGGLTITGVAASDLLPDGSAGTLSAPAESISANGELNVGESWIYTISYTVTQTDVDAGTELTNTVSVVSDQVPGPTLASALTPLSASASLTVDKVQTNGPDPVTATGDIIDYTITVQNTGGLTITGVAASDLLPDGSAGTLSAPAESISANSELNVGESWIYTISYTVTQTDMDAGTELTNSVSVISDQVPGPTVASALTPLSASASLTVDKSGQTERTR